MTYTFGVNPAVTPPANDGGGDIGILITSGTLGSPGGNTLSVSGIVLSISIYVASGAAGNILLGIYDNTGAAGQAGTLLASCPSTAITNGWNTIPVSAQATLPIGTYWFAFTPSSTAPVFGTETAAGFTQFKSGLTYTMPGTAPTFTSNTTQSFGMYATLSEIFLGQEFM